MLKFVKNMGAGLKKGTIILSCLVLVSVIILHSGLQFIDKPQETAKQVQWLVDNGISLRSVDPNDTDFSDLMPLMEKIGGARVVLLGEQSHGDGPVFLMKCRLVQFLHEVMGFNILAWESGLFDCREMEAALHKDMPLHEAIAKGIFSIWGRSEQVQPVFAYARTTYDTTRPLEMTGFDCQFSSMASADYFPQKLSAFLHSSGKQLLSSGDQDLLSRAINFQNFQKLTADDRLKYNEIIGRLPGLIEDNQRLLEKTNSRKEISFWIRIAKNLPALYDVVERGSDKNRKRKATDNNVRDEAMGQTLNWLIEEIYPKEKIIVWAASMHNMRRGHEIYRTGRVSGEKYFPYEDVKTMGDWVFEEFGEETYNITFTAYKGKAGPWFSKKPFDVPDAPEGSFEYNLHKTGKKLLFVDLTSLKDQPDHWIRQDLLARPLGYAPMITDWSRHFDAVIFMEDMLPSTPLQLESKDKKEPGNKQKK